MAAPTQDLPPKGGYASIIYKRVPPKNIINGIQAFAGFGVLSAVGFYIYYQTWKRMQREKIEMRSAEMAIIPLLVAEKDRFRLKQLKANRDEEEKLMANVEGWEVGTYYGKPIYKTLDRDTYVESATRELFAHGPSSAYTHATEFAWWM